MLIGELSKKTGLSKDTLRFYEKKGLLESKARQVGTRTYMEFSPETVERIALITQGKFLGFTLNEIKHLIKNWENVAMTRAEKLQVIDRKLDEITDKMRQLEEIKIYLTTKRNRIIQEPENSMTSAIPQSLES